MPSFLSHCAADAQLGVHRSAALPDCLSSVRATHAGQEGGVVTNNSTKSRAGYLGKFTSLGLNVNAEEIYSSSYAAAAYLESINFPKDKKARPCLSFQHPF